MKEAKKAKERRLAEGWIWNDIFKGTGIDVGAGDDLYEWSGATILPFDMEHGDANKLHAYWAGGKFDFLHASQCLEHMHNPYDALINWAKVVRKGGYLVITIPDFALYEHGCWPSKYNPDHKSSWSLTITQTPAPIHVNLNSQEWKNTVAFAKCEIVMQRIVDTNYDYSKYNEDQTFDFDKRVESFLEIVLKRI
jgi:SAM-dependent methyltransferase